MLFSSFLLEEAFNKSEGKCKICLSSGSPLAYSLNEFLAFYPEDEKVEILKGLLDLKLDYSEQLGNQKFRAKLAEFYTINPDQILTTSGASEAIFLIFSTLFEPGDTIVVQDPIYQSLYQVALDMGINVISWQYDLDKDFDYNLELLKRTFTKNQRKRSRIKALVLNNPNNPTGICFDDDQMNLIVSLCKIFDRNNSFYLIVDEVFRDLAWTFQKEETVHQDVHVPIKSSNAVSSAVSLYDKAIVVSDLSKAYGFAGLRLGWIAAGAELSSVITKLSSQKNYLSLRSNTLSEYIGKHVLEKHDEIIKEKLDIVKENLDYLSSLDPETLPFEFQSLAADRGRVSLNQQAYGGLCLFPKVKAEYASFFNQLNLNKMLEEHGLFIVSGALFGKQYSDYFRLGLGLKPDQFKAALNILLMEAARSKLSLAAVQ